MIIGGLAGTFIGGALGGLCLAGAWVCMGLGALAGAAAGVGVGYLLGGGSYASDLENTINQINLGVATAQLDGDKEFSVYFYSSDGRYYVRLPDGNYLEVSEDVFNTLKQVYSTPLPEETGNADFEDEAEMTEEWNEFEEYCEENPESEDCH
jgi:hypothetical protein